MEYMLFMIFSILLYPFSRELLNEKRVNYTQLAVITGILIAFIPSLIWKESVQASDKKYFLAAWSAAWALIPIMYGLFNIQKLFNKKYLWAVPPTSSTEYLLGIGNLALLVVLGGLGFLNMN